MAPRHKKTPVLVSLIAIVHRTPRAAGSTLTVVFITGELVTVANLGDSSAVLDSGTELLELTKSHRLVDNREEQVCSAMLCFKLA